VRKYGTLKCFTICKKVLVLEDLCYEESGSFPGFHLVSFFLMSFKKMYL